MNKLIESEIIVYIKMFYMNFLFILFIEFILNLNRAQRQRTKSKREMIRIHCRRQNNKKTY